MNYKGVFRKLSWSNLHYIKAYFCRVWRKTSTHHKSWCLYGCRNKRLPTTCPERYCYANAICETSRFFSLPRSLSHAMLNNSLLPPHSLCLLMYSRGIKIRSFQWIYLMLFSPLTLSLCCCYKISRFTCRRKELQEEKFCEGLTLSSIACNSINIFKSTA